MACTDEHGSGPNGLQTAFEPVVISFAAMAQHMGF